MSDAKKYDGNAIDLTVKEGGGGNVVATVNCAISNKLGGGIGVFENCHIPWTVTYDEIIYGLKGTMEIHTEEGIHTVGAGDIMWLPAGTELIYVANEAAKFFFAVAPCTESKAGQSTVVHTPVPPEPKS
ncbi:MAG: ethanolamine utilization protein EutQ [Rhodospirillaceae bacterium]|nr:ethanolamine utilization protein EutQ [Rhodospirillaceae bacterium]|tara:strand:- start:81 stop:467 length:387 start_codon:yes stop_codon:yes gene_type:complete